MALSENLAENPKVQCLVITFLIKLAINGGRGPFLRRTHIFQTWWKPKITQVVFPHGVPHGFPAWWQWARQFWETAAMPHGFVAKWNYPNVHNWENEVLNTFNPCFFCFPLLSHKGCSCKAAPIQAQRILGQPATRQAILWFNHRRSVVLSCFV